MNDNKPFSTNEVQELKDMGYKVIRIAEQVVLPFNLRHRITQSGTVWSYQVSEPNGKCNVTGEPMSWNGRKWRLSQHMTDSEIVQTMLKAVLTAQEHEAREGFLYRGKAIFDPHYDVDLLWELRARDDALSEREAA